MINRKYYSHTKDWAYIPVLCLCLLACSVFTCVTFLPSNLSDCAAATEKDIETGLILSSAETLFKAMKAKDYPLIWTLLSQRSKDMIVASISRAEKQKNVEHKESDISNDLSSGESLAKSYWDAYVNQFDARLVLDESRWEIGEIKDTSATIRLYYRKSEVPTVLRMLKEKGKWVTGLMETWPPAKKS